MSPTRATKFERGHDAYLVFAGMHICKEYNRVGVEGLFWFFMRFGEKCGEFGIEGGNAEAWLLSCFLMHVCAHECVCCEGGNGRGR